MIGRMLCRIGLHVWGRTMLTHWGIRACARCRKVRL